MSLPSPRSQPWGVELPVAYPGTGEEWYRVLYSPQIRNKDHQRASTGMSTSRAVADLEGVPWVPWNPPFEGLPSRILSKSAQT